MHKRLWMMVVALAALLLTSIAFLPRPVAASPAGQTIPSRTPTPAEPTAPPNTPVPQPTSPPGAATNTPAVTNPPGTTATSPPAVELVETPVGGFLPTAAPCTEPPTAQAQGTLNVRSGPGIAYEVVGQLGYLETRPITGRAATATWWQLELADGTSGWVSHSIVLVQGYTGRVPVVDLPPLQGGSTPTPGTPWSPTPDPQCTPLPTYTPTAVATLPPTSAALASPTPAGNEVAAASPEPQMTPTATRDLSTATPRSLETNTAAATAEPLPNEEEAGGSMNWLPLAGLGLLAAGVAVYFVRRR